MSAASPRWLRLTRAGDVVTGYDSADGTELDQDRHRHPARAGSRRCRPGCSPPPRSTRSRRASRSPADPGSGGPTDATATFDRVGLQGGWPGSSWTGTAVSGGSNSQYLTGSEAGYRQADGAFAVTGSGDIAPGAAGGTPMNTELAGVFIGLIAVVVAGALFITAEYRRGMIRLTLAASPAAWPRPGCQSHRPRRRHLRHRADRCGRERYGPETAGCATGPPSTRRRRSPRFGSSPEPRRLSPSSRSSPSASVPSCGSAGAVTVVITAIIVPYLLAAVSPVLPAGAADWLLRLTPAAGFAIQQAIPAYPQVAASYTPFQGYFPLARWGLRRPMRVRGARPGPGRLPATPEGRVGRSLHAEWTKLRTLASTG